MLRILAGATALTAMTLAGCTTQYQLPGDAEASGSFAWCADFGNDLGTNCGFVTLEQCRAALGGIGGQCYPNPERGVTETARPE